MAAMTKRVTTMNYPRFVSNFNVTYDFWMKEREKNVSFNWNFDNEMYTLGHTMNGHLHLTYELQLKYTLPENEHSTI